MKSLYESLLDDFDTLNQNASEETRKNQPLLKDTWFKIGSDFKTLVFEPTTCDYLSDLRDVTPYIYWGGLPGKSGNYERSFGNIDVCKKLKLKFQPLTTIYDDLGGSDEEWFKYFDCEYAVNFKMTLEKRANIIDFSKLKFPVKGSIVLTSSILLRDTPRNSVNKVLPYDKELELVCFYEIPKEPIKGWKCKNMVIGNEPWENWGYDQDDILGENWEEWINDLLRNNPETETVYISGNILSEFGKNKKVVTKGRGSKRAFVKFSKVPQTKWNSTCYVHANSELRRLCNEVDAWRWTHQDLFECDGATPGNTIGIGNPMAPTDTTPGTEPILPTHPRSKKKTKKDMEKIK